MISILFMFLALCFIGCCIITFITMISHLLISVFNNPNKKVINIVDKLMIYSLIGMLINCTTLLIGFFVFCIVELL